MKIAAIDIGSNSIKLVVAERTAGDNFSILRQEKDVVRLGHNTLRDRHLAPAAIERAARAIKKFCDIAESYKADHTVAIATASVREADNATEFVAEVWQQTNLRVEILSGIEEARLIGLAVGVGCASL
nr:Ppx/GppA family phosphatase [Acidobacteriota bacterium]